MGDVSAAQPGEAFFRAGCRGGELDPGVAAEGHGIVNLPLDVEDGRVADQPDVGICGQDVIEQVAAAAEGRNRPLRCETEITKTGRP